MATPTAASVTASISSCEETEVQLLYGVLEPHPESQPEPVQMMQPEQMKRVLPEPQERQRQAQQRVPQVLPMQRLQPRSA